MYILWGDTEKSKKSDTGGAFSLPENCFLFVLSKVQPGPFVLIVKCISRCLPVPEKNKTKQQSFAFYQHLSDFTEQYSGTTFQVPICF